MALKGGLERDLGAPWGPWREAGEARRGMEGLQGPWVSVARPVGAWRARTGGERTLQGKGGHERGREGH